MDNIRYNLMEAVRIGNLESVRDLINRCGLLCSTEWTGGYVLLRISTELKHTEITKLLLNSGSKVNSKNRKPSNTPLHFSAENGDLEIVEMLLNRGAKINAKNKRGSTPLLCAVRKGNKEVVELLLNRGAYQFGNRWQTERLTNLSGDPNKKKTRKGLHEIVEKLLRLGADVNSACTANVGRTKKFNPQIDDNITPLHIAAEKGLSNIIEQLIRLGADVNSASQKGFTPLHFAVANRKKETSELLLNCGANANAIGHFFINPFQISNGSFKENRIPKNTKGITPLHVAAEHGLSIITEQLLKHGANVNSASSEGLTPLHFAIAHDNKDTIELLTKHGANIDAKASCFTNIFHIEHKHNEEEYFPLIQSSSFVSHKTAEEFTPLHFAAKNNDTDIIKMLLNHNACIEPCEDYYMTPLYVALQCNSTDAAKLLFENGANIDAEVRIGKTILNAMVTNRYLLIVEEILKHFNPDLNNDSNKESLYIACKHFHMENKKIVQCLLEYGFNLKPEDVYESTLVYSVIKMGYSKLVEYLIEYGLDLRLQIKDSLPLHIAVKNQAINTATLLLTHGADANATDNAGNTPMVYATENSDIQMANLLLSFGANIKEKNELLKIAINNSSTEMVETLLKNEIDVESLDRLGRTALNYTAINDDVHIRGESAVGAYTYPDDDDARGEIARLLLNHGANVNAKTFWGKGFNTLQLACQNNFKNLVDILLKYNVDIDYSIEETNARSAFNRVSGKTALHIIAEDNNVDLLNMLIKGGANLDCQGRNGYTPLHLAAEEGNIEVALELVKEGAFLEIKDDFGYTPLHISCTGAQTKLVLLLLKYGSDINSMTNENKTPLDLAREVDCYSDDEREEGEEEENYESFTLTRIFKKHLIKLKVANLFINEQNLSKLNELDGWLTSFQSDCAKEVNLLKQEKIASEVSFYNILKKNNNNSLAKYAKNENIVKAVETNSYKSKFPIYADMIERNFKKGFQRKSLLEQSYGFFECYIKLPYDCVDHIMSFLADTDLKSIINLWEQLSNS